MPPRVEPARDPRVLAVTTPSCQVFDALPQHALAITFQFDAAPDGDTPPRPVHLIGELTEPRVDVDAPSSTASRFDMVHVIPAIPAGVGRVAVTMRVRDVAAGRWHVIAEPERDLAFETSGDTGGSAVVTESAPGVSLGSWAAFVALGTLVGLVLLAIEGETVGLPVATLLRTAVLACVAGLVGAKVYYKAQAAAPSSWWSPGGMCIQGFVLAAVGTLLLGATVTRMPVLLVLDAMSAPLLVGIAVGRIGCFRAGCCVGRLHGGRIALWSSDRYIGARRIPTQLLEGIGALSLAAVAVVMLRWEPGMPAGSLALQSMGTYVLIRQILLPLRALDRRTDWRRPVTASLSATALAAAVGAMLLAAS